MTNRLFKRVENDGTFGKKFLDKVSFAPWRLLCLHVRQKWYRVLRYRFSVYYLGQMFEWRRGAGKTAPTAVSSLVSMSVSGVGCTERHGVTESRGALVSPPDTVSVKMSPAVAVMERVATGFLTFSGCLSWHQPYRSPLVAQMMSSSC